MSIYPTFLYIKQHSLTGLKYFGKTTLKDPYKYEGSGKYWVLHIKKHGKEHIVTTWVSESYTDSDLISEFALKFSRDNNIVESNDWANLINENGLDGGVKGSMLSEETKAKLSASLCASRKSRPARILSEETKAKISASLSGKPRSEEIKAKISVAKLGIPKSEEAKAKMSVAGKGKTISEETKAKISASLSGKPRSEEIKAKISNSRRSNPHSEETKAKAAATRLRNQQAKILNPV